MASTAVTLCFYSSSGGSPSGLTLPTWLHRRSKNQGHCSSGPVQMTACVRPVQTPSFLTVWCNLGITHSQVILQQIKCFWEPDPTFPNFPSLPFISTSQVTFRIQKSRDKSVFWFLLEYIVTLCWVFFTEGCAKERWFWVKLLSILPTK